MVNVRAFETPNSAVTVTETLPGVVSKLAGMAAVTKFAFGTDR